jgi:hypothetical protein
MGGYATAVLPFAAQAVIAIENARLLMLIRHQREQCAGAFSSAHRSRRLDLSWPLLGMLGRVKLQYFLNLVFS